LRLYHISRILLGQVFEKYRKQPWTILIKKGPKMFKKGAPILEFFGKKIFGSNFPVLNKSHQ
jgi:hypothetical protein